MAQFPNNPSTAIPGSSAGGLQPYQAPVGGMQQIGDGAAWASMAMPELLAMIAFRDKQLAAQRAAADQQAQLARDQMGQQAGQFGQQLAFNQVGQAQQFQAGLYGMRNDDLQMRLQAQGQALGGASSEALARQGLALQGYSAAEQARVAQQNVALQQAQLVASLRGPSNAFKQLEVNLGLNRAGQSNLMGALAGDWGVPQYMAPGGSPEAATLQTMARDAGSAPGGGPNGENYGAAGIMGLLGLASQNARLGADGSTLAAQQAQAARQGQIAEGLPVPPMANDPMGTGPMGRGAQINSAWVALLKARDGVIPEWNDPAVLSIWKGVGNLSDAQALKAAQYAHHYAKVTGRGMAEGQMNDMLGQIELGYEPDSQRWRPIAGQPTTMPGPLAGAAPGAPPANAPPGFPPPVGPAPGPRPPAGAPPAGTVTSPGIGPDPNNPSAPWSPTLPPLVIPPAQAAAIQAAQNDEFDRPEIVQRPDGSWGPPLPVPTTPPPVSGAYSPGMAGYVPPAGNGSTPGAGPGPAQPTATGSAQWVTLPDGRGAYKTGNSYYDGNGEMLGTDPANLRWTSYYGAPPAQPQQAQPQTAAPAAPYQAPAAAPVAATATAAPTPAAQPKPSVTYRYDWLGGAHVGQQGYTGTDGSVFNAQWDKLS